MAHATYILHAGEAFVPPTHPGNQPNHLPAATQSQITAANRQCDNLLEFVRRYTQVCEALRQQILLGIDTTYYHVLEDETFDMPMSLFLPSLLIWRQATCTTLSANNLELNCMRLTDIWNLNEPLENLWICIKHLRAVAIAGGEPLSDSTVMQLT